MRIPLPRTRTGKIAALAVTLSVLIPVIAFSVDNSSIFELEGNAVDNSATGDDWQNVADDRPGGPGLINQNNSLVSTFLTDGLDATDQGFTGGGSKDVNDVTQWQYQTGAVSPSKNEIGHAFAAAYNDPSNGHLLVYFGLDRSGAGGTAATGFWFFKDKVSIGANGKFTGKHTVGDILVTSDYVTGGKIGEINVFRWVGGSKPLAVVGSSSTGGGTTAGDRFCLNTTGTETTPLACAASNSNPEDVPYPQWTDYYFQVGGAFVKQTQFPARTFYEGGVDLTQIFGAGNSTCFSSFMAMTRTSASTSAQLKDFAVGDFSLCDMSVAKACVLEDGVSPVVNSDGTSIHTKFKVTISNTGFGPVNDVQLVETAALGGTSGNSCQIKSISLGTGGTTANPAASLNTDLVTDTPVEVAQTIAGKSAIDVNLECDSLANPFLNKVETRAKSFPGAGTPDIVRTYRIEAGADDPVPGDECAADISPMLDVTKDCVDDKVTLVNTSGGMKARACFSIEVTNTGNVQLTNVQLLDPKILHDSNGDAINLLPANTVLGPAGASNDSKLLGDTDHDGVIETGEGLCFEALGPDGGETDPEKAEFGNTVDAYGTPALADPTTGLKTTQHEMASDSCPLCN